MNRSQLLKNLTANSYLVSYNELKDSCSFEPLDFSYLKNLSRYFKQKINVRTNGKVIRSYGKYFNQPAINFEFVKNRASCRDFQSRSNAVEEKKLDKISYHDCPFNILRFQSVRKLNTHKQLLSERKRKKQKRLLKKRSISKVTDSRLRGGATYRGNSKNDAKRILDSSQKGISHPDRRPGHPRGHASDPTATEPTDSVEKYSNSGRKTGFLSRSDQDYIAHYVLQHINVREVMELLNEMGDKAFKEAVTIKAAHLSIPEEEIPQVQEWLYGKRVGTPGRMKQVVVVLKHFFGKSNDEDADVFILTLYPMMY